ncbi:IclR family transcriptional regulator [Leucobacter chinensis]|uniref:IclR family transcriptional regulator n=1 Tax=Leucobacter chinensis TaxID=2851010 RepID=UPI001C243DCC|nr:IclR family transcriptional regulator [Leucobacter chinensis]
MKNRTVERTLGVLELIAEVKGGINQARIAEQLEIPKSTLHSFLAALEEKRYIKQDRHGVFTLDIASLALGNAYLDSTDLSQDLGSALELILDELNVTAHLASLDGPSVLYLHKLDPAGNQIKLASAIGTRHPAHLTAAGRACLMQLPTPRLQRFMRYATAEGVEAIDLDLLEQQLTEARRIGFAVDHGSLIAGVTTVAVPISSPEHFSGSIGVSFLTGAIEVEHAAQVLSNVARETIAQVSMRSIR